MVASPEPSEVVALLNKAEVTLATLRHDDRPAVPENPGASIGEVVRVAEGFIETAKSILRGGCPTCGEKDGYNLDCIDCVDRLQEDEMHGRR